MRFKDYVGSAFRDVLRFPAYVAGRGIEYARAFFE